ncbi:nicotinate-nucleotide--dimethylbenzimidazole phosphoribosyltransferase [Stutzerimonas zhaodongensis]|uniref:Nicotinate-nucleotide--dimethylbenzimidazole phosphoribosyltransferase n=1 Tax=Stutzerimonas zhaodongensis TaxID=1176257 RepID=A0A3M2HJA1_9GAMM|nr:nicotinate-nucleotide--dimethylbenzimidazole phosphoribosyltransferase [Stutzerimonas zhaodongensis]MCQ4316129.1 nicotinate-nucleotide--dimethylbenzimidazole phosphoribosyltransferase [Stutzerimonas zhaodongensis]RMH89811.1 nicotinate-nucleotide--dimethylbenzimidazole phosphoribosyltransferase [Stutzerimonas zhaodongensis]
MSKQWWQEACQALDESARQAARLRDAQLTKPAGALGRIDALVPQLAALQHREHPRLDELWIAIFAGDHGVAEEGISAYPQSVTGQMLGNFVNGGAAISVLASQLGAELEVIDLGTAVPLPPMPQVRHLALGPGTRNFTQASAMSADTCARAMQAGRDSVVRAGQLRTELFIGGEMGIGNTTTAAALACALMSCAPQALAGPGTGLDAAGVAHKCLVIERALTFHAGSHDTVEWMQRLGGFELAALTGAYIACAQQGIVALVDGFICSVAALCAVRLNPGTRDWLLFAHRSAEPGHAAVLAEMNAQPLLDLGLRLGEGSGAALAVPLLRLACVLHDKMATFEEAAVAAKQS